MNKRIRKKKKKEAELFFREWFYAARNWKNYKMMNRSAQRDETWCKFNIGSIPYL